MSQETSKEDPVIEVKGLGYCDQVNFTEFAEQVIQEYTVAVEEAQSLINGTEVLTINSDQPEYYQEFRLLDRQKLIDQIEPYLDEELV
jgi:hypothetical protein